MKAAVLGFCLGAMYVVGYSAGEKASSADIRKAYVKGCEKGGNAPLLTPWPLCPQAADNYVHLRDIRGNE
jgi:hypothetical protein